MWSAIIKEINSGWILFWEFAVNHVIKHTQTQTDDENVCVHTGKLTLWRYTHKHLKRQLPLSVSASWKCRISTHTDNSPLTLSRTSPRFHFAPLLVSFLSPLSVKIYEKRELNGCITKLLRRPVVKFLWCILWSECFLVFYFLSQTNFGWTSQFHYCVYTVVAQK